MSPSARFAETDFPAEVEDLIASLPLSTSPSCTAVAGYAVLASASYPHALVFAIAAGSGLDALPVPLQPNPGPHAPALVAWLREHDGAAVRSVAVAALTRDGVLSVYRSVDVRAPARPRCAQVRVGSALSASARTDALVPALHIARDKDGVLFVFGARGTAVRVVDNATSLQVTPLSRCQDDSGASSLRFGAMFYTAIRSIGVGGVSRDGEWETGEGRHKIVASAATLSASGVVVVRRGGDMECWGLDGMLWACNVFDFVGGRDSNRCVVCADVTSDDTAVLLVQSRAQSDPGHRLICFDVRSTESIPHQTELDIPLNDGEAGLDAQCIMVLSGDIAYFYMEVNKTLAWLSVARGVAAEGQVQGSTVVDSDMRVLSVVDAAFGLRDSGVPGGVAAFIHQAGVWLASSAVPPPMSLDKDMGTDGLTSIAGASSVLWRSFLQYSADQKGATKASLRGLIQSLLSDGFDLFEALSEIVERISRRIIVSSHDPEKAPVALLIDTELEKKHEQHTLFLRLLSDAEVFSELRPDAPSVTEDRIWNAVKVSSRYAVVTYGEMLGAARRVRDLENRQPNAGYFQRFNDAASASFGSEKGRSGMVSRSRRGNEEEGEAVDDGPSVLNAALALGGADISSGNKATKVSDSANELYRNPHEFQRFLPALERCMSDALSKLQSEHNMADDNGAADGRGYCRAAQNIVLLSCEAAIDVVQGSREVREATIELFESLPNGMSGVENWMNDSATCGHMLMKIAQKALDVGARSREAEGRQMMHAATLVVDELLSRTPFDETTGRAHRVVRAPGEVRASPQKRRRLDLIFEGSERGKELRAALDMLRQAGMDEDAFHLAEKYGDYRTMLALRVNSPEFDEFMEASLRKFGDEFGLFAFHWLEERGEIRLLLHGQRSRSQGSSLQEPILGRSDRLNALLSGYFRSERRHVSNLAWIHCISQENTETAAETLIAQTKKTAVAGKMGSAVNTPILSSIAKLAMLACNGNQTVIAGKQKVAADFVTGRLNLSKLQKILEPEGDTLLPNEELIRRFIEESSTDSESLAERVVIAVEALHFSGMGLEETQSLEDFVWRRCVERQCHVWVPIVAKISVASDIEMRQKLKDTALYKAATKVSLSENTMSEVIARGAFVCSEFAKNDCVADVTRLVTATVSLAVA